MSVDLTRPADAPELMDDPGAGWSDFSAALEDIALSNRWLGGTAAVVDAVSDLMRIAARDGHRPVHVLDVGAGGGDVGRAIAGWARSAGIDARVFSLDVSPHAVRFAAQAARAEPWMQVVRGDALRPPFAPQAMHVVHAGQFLHHVPRPEQPATLAHLSGLAAIGGVVSDLVRSPWAWHGVRAFAWATRRRRFFRHDAPLSVARGFTMEEARGIAAASGVAGVRVRRHPFGRLTWTFGPRSASPAGST